MSTQRRQFLQKSALAPFIVMSAQSALTASANSALSIGVIGCGGRGNYDARNFKRHTNSRITALADLFEDRLAATQETFSDDSPAVYAGFDGYQKVLNDDVDAVIITSPPYFHPEQFEAAVQANKHVYLEKPVSVDTAGAQRVLKAGQKGDGQLTMMVGFQSRFHPHLQEAVQRVHDGAIGEIVCGDAFYHSGYLSMKDVSGLTPQQARLRNWLFDQVLSGDILVEQNIHVIDVCNWLLQDHPIQAKATGGRKVRTFTGDTWDHYEVIFEYPNQRMIVFSSTQFLDLGWGDSGERINGSKGAFDGRSAAMEIRGENAWKPGGASGEAGEAFFQSGAAEADKMKAFYQSVESQDYINEVPAGVQSTLSSVLGRTAAYRGQAVRWDEMIAENQALDAQLDI